MTKKQLRHRRHILRMLLITTIIVLVSLAAAYKVISGIPERRMSSIETALSSGDTGEARKLAAYFDNETQTGILLRCNYIDALALENAGKYLEASDVYATAGNYEDSSERQKSCSYKYAEELVRERRWDDAAEAFKELGTYSDAADRISECRYEKAVELAEDGRIHDAALILDSLTSMEKAYELLVNLAKEMTGVSDEDKALAAFRGLTEEQLALISRISELRQSSPKDIIDVGFHHTVGLGAGGTVFACGDNSFGQCDTEYWQGATAVSAGAYHTVALLSDGTVVCAGRNTEKQCNTSGWTDIIQIATGDYATFGLRSNGEVVCTGFLGYKEISNWTGISFICAGSYGIAGIRNDGSIWFYPEMLNSDAINNVENMVIGTGYAAGVSEDGNVVCTALDLSGWQSILSLSGSGSAIMALDAVGNVKVHFFHDSESIDFSSVSNAVAISAGGTHFAIVYSDGSVEVFGDTSLGEGDTRDWILAVN